MKAVPVRDNGGRRSGMDRRLFSYAGHIPERRSGDERRSGLDRRTSRKTARFPQSSTGP